MKTRTLIQKAVEERDAHIREVVAWMFTPETGSPFWLEYAKSNLDFDPREKIKGFDDIVEHFPLFDGETYLRTVPAAKWRPQGFHSSGTASMFITGGTTGDPKRRWGLRKSDPELSDYGFDYETLAELLPKEGFPEGGSCVYIGPGGTRRLPLGTEVLAELLKCQDFNIVDMDVAWMKNPANTAKKEYKAELTDRAISALKRDDPDWAFCPPILIEAIGERIDWVNDTNVRGVFAGGTEMSPETVRNIMEELFQGQIVFYPCYGNALMGLATPRRIATFDCPIPGQEPYSIGYQPLQPRTLLRVTKPGDPSTLVNYGERGRVVIYAFTKSWFMPGFVERDTAIRLAPTDEYPWDGVADVGPSEEDRATLTTGVY